MKWLEVFLLRGAPWLAPFTKFYYVDQKEGSSSCSTPGM